MKTDLIHEFLHRAIWQNLPHGPRRRALFTSARMLAPRPSPKSPPSTPIFVAGCLRTASGLGESARLCHDAFLAEGFETYGIDISAALMQPVDQPDFVFEDGCDHEGRGTLILHVNAPMLPLALLWLGKRIVRDKFVIGYWAWELPKAPAEWRHGVPFVHEIWTPSTFVADAMRRISSGKPIRVLPHPVLTHRHGTKSSRNKEDRPFTCLTIFNMASSFNRKNPVASIEAFRIAFGDDPSARLIVKVSNVNACQQGLEKLNEAAHGLSNIEIISGASPRATLDQLHGDSDVLISLHRAEGFGLVLAEAMQQGLVVMATNWSGNIDFLNSDNGIPVPFVLIPASDSQKTYDHPDMMWAEPDISAAAEALKKLRSNAILRRHLEEAAQSFALNNWSAEKYVELAKPYLGLAPTKC